MKKLTKISIAVSSALGLLLTKATNVFADTLPTIGLRIATDAPSFGGLGAISFSSMISGLIRFILVIAAIIFFFTLVIGGVQWIVSGGDKTGTESARKRITNALIGLAIVFVAFAIVSLINALFGVDIFNLTIPKLNG